MDVSSLTTSSIVLDNKALADNKQQALQTNAASIPNSLQSSQNLTVVEGVKVTLSNFQPVSDPVFEPLVRVDQSEFNNQSGLTKTSHQLMRQLEGYPFGNRLNGAGNRFSELLASGDNSYQQELRNYSYFSRKEEAGNPVDFSEFSVTDRKKVQELDFSIKTESGATIRFNLQSFEGKGSNPDKVLFESGSVDMVELGQKAFFNSTEISFEIEGELTKEEREQFQALGEKLEKFFSDYQKDGTPSLKDLDLSSFDTIQSLKLKSSGGAQTKLELEYNNTQSERHIKLTASGNTAEITIDKNNQLIYNQQGKQQALSHYLKLLDDSANDAKADDLQQHMMRDVLAAGFELTEEELSFSQAQEAEFDSRLNSKEASDVLNSNKAIIPLPDFEFEFTSRKDRPNLEDKPLEYKGFNLTLSLSSKLMENDSTTIKQQTQDFKISGAYYEPLAHLERPDFEYQNYRYTTFDRQQTDTLTIVSEDNELISATIDQQRDFNSRTQEFSEDKLIKTESDEDEFNKIKDLTESLRLDTEFTQMQIIDAVLIEPFE